MCTWLVRFLHYSAAKRQKSEGICQGNADSRFLLKFVFSNVELNAKTFQDIRKYVHVASTFDRHSSIVILPNICIKI